MLWPFDITENGGGTIITYEVYPHLGQGLYPRYNPHADIENMNPTSSQCSCSTGRAIIKSDGSCGCENNGTIKVIDTDNNGSAVIRTTAANTVKGSVNQPSLLDTLKNNQGLAIGAAIVIGFLIFKK